ncbi:MAG: thermonuclease family protein [Pseudomonadota bacterium]
MTFSPRLKTITWVLALSLFFSGQASLARAGELLGRTVKVMDGDSLMVRGEGKKWEVRLFGIDCPEWDQPFGREAREATASLALNRDVLVEARGRDQYGRVLGVVRLPNGGVLNRELVRRGLAWWFRQFDSRDRALQDLEKQARKKKVGLWADGSPVPPWDWRRRRR